MKPATRYQATASDNKNKYIYHTNTNNNKCIRYVCRATNELGEDMTEASLVCRPLPHLQWVNFWWYWLQEIICFIIFAFSTKLKVQQSDWTAFLHNRFQLPPFETEDPSEQLQLIKEATQRHGVGISRLISSLHFYTIYLFVALNLIWRFRNC